MKKKKTYFSHSSNFGAGSKPSRLLSSWQVVYAGTMRFSHNLKKFRRANNLTQCKVAALMNLKDGSLISRWESGFNLTDLENAFKLAEVYGVTVDTLFITLRESVHLLVSAHT